MAAFTGKIGNLLHKKLLLFVSLRFVGAATGLVLISFQYNQPLQLKYFFHHFPSLLMLVYLIDFGYSELITKTNDSISFHFIKRLLYSLAAIIMLQVVVLNVFPQVESFVKWLLIAALFIPFQAFFDVCYRVMLRSGFALHFLIYQLMFPILMLLSLVLSARYMDASKLYITFIVATLAIQIIFVGIVYRIQPSLFAIQPHANNFSDSHNMLIPFILKITPLVIYELASDIYMHFYQVDTGSGFELIRSAYFMVGILLLLLYAKDDRMLSMIKKNFIMVFLLLAMASFAITTLIINVKIILKTGFHVHTIQLFSFQLSDIVFWLVTTMLCSFYLFRYSFWISTPKHQQ